MNTATIDAYLAGYNNGRYTWAYIHPDYTPEELKAFSEGFTKGLAEKQALQNPPPPPQTPSPCPQCGQIPNGQGGEYPCQICGVPTLHDANHGCPHRTPTPHADGKKYCRDCGLVIE